MTARILSEAEMVEEERMHEAPRTDANEFCVWCLGKGCEDCFYTGFPEEWFRKWSREMRGVSRKQMARAAMAFHAWSEGEGGTEREMSMAYGVPMHMIDQGNPYNLLSEWLLTFHDLGTQADERGAGEGCSVLASIYMSEANR